MLKSRLNPDQPNDRPRRAGEAVDPPVPTADEASQAIIKRWDMPQEYLPPAEYLAFAKQRVEYERAMVARLGLSID